MMAHSNDFIVIVKKDGKVLRESKQNARLGERNVFLEFGSEYTLLLKNNNNRRAAASVHIDGTDALGGTQVIVPANGQIELERFILDGNNDHGPRFKFVSAGHSDVQDPSSPDNGLIQVSFYREKERDYKIYTNENVNPIWREGSRVDWGFSDRPLGGGGTTSRCSNPPPKGITSQTYFSNVSCDANTYGSPVCDSYGGDALGDANVDQAGATVEGSKSNQRFHSILMDTESIVSASIQIRLLGTKKPVTVKDKLHCVECGSKNKYYHKHCWRCGARLAYPVR